MPRHPHSQTKVGLYILKTMQDGYVIQTPSVPENWLYEDDAQGIRAFAKSVTRPAESKPWAECTNEEKEEFERTHPTPEPEPNE